VTGIERSWSRWHVRHFVQLHCPGPCSGEAVGSCATQGRESGQGRKAAALSGYQGVPQIA